MDRIERYRLEADTGPTGFEGPDAHLVIMGYG